MWKDHISYLVKAGVKKKKKKKEWSILCFCCCESLFVCFDCFLKWFMNYSRGLVSLRYSVLSRGIEPLLRIFCTSVWCPVSNSLFGLIFNQFELVNLDITAWECWTSIFLFLISELDFWCLGSGHKVIIINF